MLQLSDCSGLVSTLHSLINDTIFILAVDREWEGKNGGCFCLADAKTGVLFPGEPVLVGRVPREKVERYSTLCQEKAARLAAHPEHESSWESRDPNADQWGGAVRIGGLILSISGLPELGDEAVMLVLAEIGHRGNPAIVETARRIASRSGNPYWEKLRNCVFGGWG